MPAAPTPTFGTSLPGVIQFPGRERAWETTITPDQMLEVAREADRLGLHHVACADHVVVPRSRAPYMGSRWYEPVATLGFIAGATRQLRLLTHVLVLPYHNPFAVAKAFATLDRLSNGRVLLGVGVGHLKPEFKILGAPYEERGAVTDEYLQVIRALWQDDDPHFEGRYLQFRDVYLDPRPVQQPHPPIWVGGNTRRSLRRAIRLGDGWIPWNVGLAEIKTLLDYAQTLPEMAARDRPLAVVAPTDGAISFTIPQTPNRKAFTGRAEDIAEDIRAYLDAGATDLQVGFAGATLPEYLDTMRRFAAEVMPLFQK
jgi:probable F420-dependent oxidoreductase